MVFATSGWSDKRGEQEGCVCDSRGWLGHRGLCRVVQRQRGERESAAGRHGGRTGKGFQCEHALEKHLASFATRVRSRYSDPGLEKLLRRRRFINAMASEYARCCPGFRFSSDRTGTESERWIQHQARRERRGCRCTADGRFGGKCFV